jgi:hypothetical protein
MAAVIPPIARAVVALLLTVASSVALAQPLVVPQNPEPGAPDGLLAPNRSDSVFQAPGIAVWTPLAGRRLRLDLLGSWNTMATPTVPHGLSLRTLPPAHEVLYGRVGADVTWSIGRRLELRLSAGAGAAMDQSGQSVLLMDIGASLRWWFTDHWGIAFGPSLVWVPGAPLTARDLIASELSEGFDNPTPWDDPQPARSAWGEALRRTLLQIQLLHRP